MKKIEFQHFFFTFYRVATSSASTTTANSGNQNIIMMVPGATGGSPTIQRIPLPGMKDFFFKSFFFCISCCHYYS